MKTKLFQIYTYFNTIDQRYIQWAYFVFMLGLVLVKGMSDDPGGGSLR